MLATIVTRDSLLDPIAFITANVYYSGIFSRL